MSDRESERHAFLDAVRRATHEKGRHPLPAIDEDIVRTSASDGELVDRFEMAARGVGVVVHRIDPAGLRGALAERLEPGSTTVLEPVLLRRFADLRGLGATAPDDEMLFAARYGITGVDFAIAETGSIVVASGPGRWRQFSLVPPVHFAIIEERQIVPDLLDVLSAQDCASLPSNFVVITGPSRTADIAQRLVLGVHGPGAVECFVVGSA